MGYCDIEWFALETNRNHSLVFESAPKPTYYVKLANHQLVLRKKPPGTLLPSAHAVEREFR